MLVRLHIENYVLIDSLDIAFPGGLSIITGRTGAGKSILLGALSLALGGKAGPEMIGASGAGCVVEAGFSLPADSPLKAFFEENDLEWNGGSFSIRRVLSASGRSRSFIDDLPVTQGVLAELASSLVDIHSQHQTRLLTDAACQLEMLDGFAGTVKRAPKWMIRLQLEWLYRLIKEPKRIGRMMRLPKFVLAVLAQRLRRGKQHG